MKTNKIIITMLAVAAALVLTSCNTRKNEPATPINAEQFGKLMESKENDGKRFSITGYPYLNSDVTIHNDLKVMVSINSEPKGKGKHIGSVQLDYKVYENGMYIPAQFTPDDLQIYDNEGNKLGVNDKITVSFTMELDTNRSPNEGLEKLEKDERGIPKLVKAAPRYYGKGEVDIKIEKSK